MSEEWRDIPGFEGWYQVSNLGRIKSLERTIKHPQGPMIRKERILKPWSTSKGYLWVRLYKDSCPTDFTVHSLVAEIFIGPRPDGLEINHINADKSDNRPENLAYVTTQENIHHAIELGLHVIPDNTGSKNGQAKLDEDKVAEIRKLAARDEYDSERLAKRYGVAPRTIEDALAYITWKHVD